MLRSNWEWKSYIVNSSELLLIKFCTSSEAITKWTAFQLGLQDEFKGIRYSNITQFYDSLVTTVSYLCTLSLAQMMLRWPVKTCRDFGQPWEVQSHLLQRCASLAGLARLCRAPPLPAEPELPGRTSSSAGSWGGTTAGKAWPLKTTSKVSSQIQLTAEHARVSLGRWLSDVSRGR